MRRSHAVRQSLTRPLRSASFALGAVLIVLTVSAPAFAQGEQPDDEEQASLEGEARASFDAGQRAFSAMRYEQALTYFRLAYEASPHPELLYNIALSADRLRRDAE
ncbi:MAG: hypothetical protein KC668_25825, partial [Myxococcales bacterium]|nr:hypothetical protein [Myxococcales bacterium]